MFSDWLRQKVENLGTTVSHAQGGTPTDSTNAPSKGGGTMANDIAGVPTRLFGGQVRVPNGTRVQVSAGTYLVKVSDGIWIADSPLPSDSPLLPPKKRRKRKL